MAAPTVVVPATGQLVSSFKMQAIVLVHGMGEQRPMDTVKSFADAVWTSDDTVTRNGHSNPGEIWSKPDTRTGSLELRRLTTRQSTPSPGTYPDGSRQDFYELYWADLSGGGTWDQTKNWIWMLLLRNPFTRVPRGVMLAWLLMWVAAFVVLFFLLLAALPAPKPGETMRIWDWPVISCFKTWPSWTLLVIVGAMSWVAHTLIVPYFGRVVRYTRAIPDNIAARKAIRERGLKLLEELHREDYDRIILVAHSLGAILAYDLLSYFWASRGAAHTVKRGTPEFDHLRDLEGIVARFEAETDAAKRQALLADYDVKRRALSRALRQRPTPATGTPDTRWLITDFVTVGSPLGHAEFLLTDGPDDLQALTDAREFATCPPLREVLDAKVRDAAQQAGLPVDPADPRLFCFPLKHNDEWQLHHAAQFAVVRWTNIHDPASLVFLGDVISTPAVPVYGPGVKDIDARALRGRTIAFTHTRYWENGTPTPEPLKALRDALDLAAQRGP